MSKLAWEIYEVLRKSGIEIGNASVPFIQKAIARAEAEIAHLAEQLEKAGDTLYDVCEATNTEWLDDTEFPTGEIKRKFQTAEADAARWQQAAGELAEIARWGIKWCQPPISRIKRFLTDEGLALYEQNLKLWEAQYTKHTAALTAHEEAKE